MLAAETISLDHLNRVLVFTTSANRSFAFEYDRDSDEIVSVRDEHAIWIRQRATDGSLTTKWVSESTGSFWMGKVSVDRESYKVETTDRNVTIRSDGTKYIEYFKDGAPSVSTKEDRFGNAAVEDLKTGTVRYRFVDGRSALRYTDTGSLIGYDPTGRMVLMKDPKGRRFEFSDFDANNNPQSVVNELGKWYCIAPGMWHNQSTDRDWFGDIEVSNAGSCTYVDASGKSVSFQAH